MFAVASSFPLSPHYHHSRFVFCFVQPSVSLWAAQENSRSNI